MIEENIDFELTGERHIPVHAGLNLSLANIDHMLRYAFASSFVKGKRVLDISSGNGYGSQYLAIMGAKEVVGIDSDPKAIDFASRFYHHSCVTYINGDAHKLDMLEDASFDLIVSFETIEHLQHPRLFLLELRRLLKTGGQLFISCPNDYRVTISSWLSEYHLHKFRFNEFRDLFLHIFQEGVFLGQNFTVASCLTKPFPHSAKFYQHGAYLQPLSENFFGSKYLEDISSIENADGYFAVYGVEESQICNHISISQNAFHVIMKDLIQAEKLRAELSQRSNIPQMHLETLQKAQQEIAYLQATITAMQTSKFWKLRELWFSFKKLFGIKSE